MKGDCMIGAVVVWCFVILCCIGACFIRILGLGKIFDEKVRGDND